MSPSGIDVVGDLILWEQVCQGSGRAFEQVYERYADAVYNHCFRRTGLWSVSEDLTSVVFLETWRQRDRVKLVDGNVLPWLLGIANNCVRRQARSVARHRRAIARLPIEPSSPDPAEDVAGRIDDQRQMRLVLDAMRHLTQVEHEVISLCVWGGLTYAEAAIAMSVPIGTVRSRLARARRRLAAHNSATSENTES